MNIVILSRGPQLFSTQHLMFAGLKRGHFTKVIDFMACRMVLEKGKPQVYYGDQPLDNIDAIIPRIGSSVTFYGTSVIQQFESMGVYTATTSQALLKSRDKFKSLQLLCESGVDFPRTAFPHYGCDIKQVINSVGGVPVVIKLLKGTHGLGVVLADKMNTAESMVEAFMKIKERVIIQEFIQEASGRDVRAFVVNGEVVGSMRRQANPGEFRSNLHRGGSSVVIDLTDEERETALKAVEVMGLEIAGVDMLQSNRGPLVLEVNPSPGLEGITMTTGVDIAGKIIEMLEKKVKVIS